MSSRITAPHRRARSTAARFIVTAGIAGALVSGSILTASAATAAPAPGVPEVTAGLDYVALGDSYSAGLGLAPATGLPTPECGQSAVNFPHQIAAAYGLALTDVTCSGADTGNITTIAQYPDAAPQITALSADTDIVTLTVGGNDLDFEQVIGSCIAVGPNGPLLLNPNAADCATFYNTPIDLLAARIATETAPALAATYAQIATAAPNARVFVVGYPSIFPGTLPEGGCFSTPFTGLDSFPFTATDTLYLHSVQQKLDAAIQSAAAAAGFTYVPTYASTDGNSACAPVGTAFVNGVTLTEAGATDASLHPNALGVTFLTDSVSTAIDASFPAVAPVEPAVPTVPVASGPAAAAAAPASLAATGVDSSLLGGALALAALLIAGGAFVTLRRRAS